MRTYLVVSPPLITATLFIVPFILIVLGTDLWSSYIAKATDFYWVMSFPVGTGVATSPPVRALHHKSILILQLGSRTKAGTADSQFGARLALSRRSLGVLQMGVEGSRFLVLLHLWTLMFSTWDLMGIRQALLSCKSVCVWAREHMSLVCVVLTEEMHSIKWEYHKRRLRHGSETSCIRLDLQTNSEFDVFSPSN